MRHLIWIFAVASLLAVMPIGPAFSKPPPTGFTLFQWCSINNPKSVLAYQKQLSCIVYIMGVGDHVAFVRKTDKKAFRFFCASPKVKTGQVRLIYIKWAKKYPEKLHLPAAWALMMALNAVFPCE